jgi:multiple sugar transport system substrate-binding protein
MVPPFKGTKIVVAAVGDTALLPALNTQRGEWMASRGAELEVRAAAVDPRSVGEADVLIFPADRLGDLVDAGALLVWPESLVRPVVKDDSEERSEDREPEEKPADPLQFDDLLAAERDDVSKYGNERIGLPYGGTALVLVYRRAALDREANRAAAKAAGVSLEPPRTWEQLDKLAQFLQGRDWDGDGSDDFGIALAMGDDPEELADAVYLARAASLGQHRDQYSFLFDADSMDPRIDSPPFVEALQAHVALRESGPADMVGFDAEAARAAFRKGNVALLIDRAERAARWSGGGKAIGVAPLPGSDRVYDPIRKDWESVKPANAPSYLPFGGGWLVGVSKTSQGPRREAAIDFAKYLVSPETSSRLLADRTFPMVPVRGAQLSQGLPDPRSAPGVDSRQWSEAVSQTLTARRVVPGLRIPEARAYLADLAKARAATLKGTPAESALRDTAKAWTARTSSLGRARQLWHYRRSLNNNLATLPQMPDRGQ